jgi:hypothetical protein
MSKLCERLAVEVVQHKDCSLVHGEAAEGLVEDAGVGAWSGAHPVKRGDFGRANFADASPAASPHRHPRRVDGDSLDPGIESVRVAEPTNLAPRDDERLLGGIAGVGLVTEDRSGESVHGIHPSANNQLERIKVACSGPIDDRPVDLGSDRVSLLRSPI